MATPASSASVRRHIQQDLQATTTHTLLAQPSWENRERAILYSNPAVLWQDILWGPYSCLNPTCLPPISYPPTQH